MRESTVPGFVPGEAPYNRSRESSERDRFGRFRLGNTAAVVAGEHSTKFWTAKKGTRHALVKRVLADAGFTLKNAPAALREIAEGIAMAVLVRDAAFERVCVDGGPMTTSGRPRRGFTVWSLATERLQKHVALLPARPDPRVWVSRDELVTFATLIADVVARHVPDPAQKRAIIDDIRRAQARTPGRTAEATRRVRR